MPNFTTLRIVRRDLGSIEYAETAWVPGEAILAQVTLLGIPQYKPGDEPVPSSAAELFNWCVRALTVGELPAADKIQLWQLSDLREAAGLPRGPETRLLRRP